MKVSNQSDSRVLHGGHVHNVHVLDTVLALTNQPWMD